jgi:hypothetical protein
MLDLAYTALLDFLARLKKSPSKTESVEQRFVPIQGDAPIEAKGVEKNAPEQGSNAPRLDNSLDRGH